MYNVSGKYILFHLLLELYKFIHPCILLDVELSDEKAAVLTDEEKVHRFLRATLRDMANKTVCVIISQPLQVGFLKSVDVWIHET